MIAFYKSPDEPFAYIRRPELGDEIRITLTPLRYRDGSPVVLMRDGHAATSLAEDGGYHCKLFTLGRDQRVCEIWEGELIAPLQTSRPLL